MEAADYPRQGEIYLIRALKNLGDTKKRPAVVVSLNVRNQWSRTVLVVPFSSDVASGISPTRILIAQGEGGLTQDSIALCDNISAIRKIHLEQGPYGAISASSLERIQCAIQVAIGVFTVEI